MKKLILIALLLITCLSLTACTSYEEQLSEKAVHLEREIVNLNNEIYELKNVRDALETEIVDTKIANGTAKYVITFNIRQSHFTLDLSEHLKDKMNDVSIQIPVDKEYYDSVNVGDVIDDSFRMGSFIWKGSFGSWKITIEDKEIQ